MRNKLVFILVAVVCLLVMSSGCILSPDSQQKKYVSHIFIDVPVTYEAVANINYTFAKQGLEEIGYNVTTYLDADYGPKTNDYGLNAYNFTTNSYPLPELEILISARKYNETMMASFWVHYAAGCNPNHKDPNNLDEAKLYAKNKAIEVAQACNLTADWDNAVFSVSYSE